MPHDDGSPPAESTGLAASVDRLRATAHPLRLRMLSLLTGQAMSAAEVARKLGITQANASYHLRLLERAQLLTIVEEVRIRGGAARRYRHEDSAEPQPLVDPPSDSWEAEARSHWYSALAEALRERAARAIPGPTIGTDAEVWVEPDVWRDVVTTIADASARLHAAARPIGSEGAIAVSMSAALFRVMPDVGADRDGTSA